MSADLTRFGLREMLRCGVAIRKTAGDAATMEDALRSICRFLYDELRDGSGERQCVMVRAYKTHAYAALDGDLQAFARTALGREPEAGTRCLTLMATVGEERDWNDRHRSRGHRAIPLASEELVLQAPMIAQLLTQFGVDIGAVVNPSPEVVRDLQGKTYGIFHVEDARGSPYIPAQDFVESHGVRAVLGFGGSLRTGDLYAIILFCRVAVPAAGADRFRTLALDVKGVLFDFDETEVFDRGDDAPLFLIDPA